MRNPLERKQILLQCMQCAEACFTLLFELACRPGGVQETAKKCLKQCEECAALCDEYDTPELERCARACRHSSHVLRQLVMPFMLN